MKVVTRVTLILMLGMLLVLSSAQPAQAAEFIDDGKIAADEVIDDDVFLSGDQVVMDGTVNGLLMAAGETVTINGTVNGDLFAFGNNIVITDTAQIEGNIFFGSRTASVSGQVNGSVFGGSAAATLVEGASIGRNLYYGGYSFEMLNGAQVTRDLYVGGYQAIVAGEIGRDAGFGGGALEFSGSVGRDLKADVEGGDRTPTFLPNNFGQDDLPEAIQPGVRIAENAVIGNRLIYISRTPQLEAIKAEPAGGVIVQTPVPNDSNQAAPAPVPTVTVRYPILGWLAGVAREAITLLVFGALAMWLLPLLLQRTLDQARSRPGASAGYGLLTLFGGYFSILVAVVVILLIGIILGALTLSGLAVPVFGVGFTSLALFIAVFTLIVTTISKVIVSFLIGHLLLERVAPNSPNRQIWELVAGVIIYVLVRSIPFVGWLVGLAATLIGIGALWLAYQAWRRRDAETPVMLSSQEGTPA